MTNPKNDQQPQDTPDVDQEDLDINWDEALAEQQAGEAAQQAAQEAEQADSAQQSDSSDPTDDIDWAAAMAEQQAGEAAQQAQAAQQGDDDSLKSSQAQGLSGLDDSWAEALAEQAQGSGGSSATQAQMTATQSADQDPAAAAVFKPLDQHQGVPQSEIDMIMDIPVQLSVELGRTRVTIKNILQLGQGSVVELDGLAGEPMDIFVNGYLIAQGEVVVVDDKYGIRITDIITPSDRIHRLNTRR